MPSGSGLGWTATVRRGRERIGWADRLDDHAHSLVERLNGHHIFRQHLKVKVIINIYFFTRNAFIQSMHH